MLYSADTSVSGQKFCIFGPISQNIKQAKYSTLNILSLNFTQIAYLNLSIATSHDNDPIPNIHTPYRGRGLLVGGAFLPCCVILQCHVGSILGKQIEMLYEIITILRVGRLRYLSFTEKSRGQRKS